MALKRSLLILRAFLLLILLTNSPFAPARGFFGKDGFLGCIGALKPGGQEKVLPSQVTIQPSAIRAIDFDKMKPGSYTVNADRFMQIMWPYYLAGKDVSQVRDSFFTEFIVSHLAEIKANHLRNWEFVESDFGSKGLEISDLIRENFKSFGNYIQWLETKVTRNENFSYMESLVFSYQLVVSRERAAFDKLDNLFKPENSQQLAKRYPSRRGLDPTRVKPYGKNFEEYWERIYRYHDQLERPVDKTFRFRFNAYENEFNDAINKIMPFATHVPAGFASFFSTYHFPISPLTLASEFDMIDNATFVSPLNNLRHDFVHWRGLAQRDHKKSIYRSLDEVLNLQNDLIEIKKQVQATGDTELFKVMNFLFYNMKFEGGTEEAADVDLAMLVLRLQDLTQRLNNLYLGVKTQGRITAYNLFNNYRETPYAPASSFKVLVEKAAQVALIVTDYQLKKSRSLNPMDHLRRFKLKKILSDIR